MRTQGLSLFMWLGVLSLGCGDDGGSGAGTEGSSGSDTGTAGMTSTPMTATTAGMTTTAGMDGTSTGEPPPGDTSTGEPPGDTSTGEPPADSSGTAGESGTDTGTTGGGGSAYPPCMPDADPVCPEPYTGCYEFAPKGFSVCIVADCEDPDACPQPASGDAPAICGGPNMDTCVLDCSDDQTCPDDMDCIDVAPGIGRCMWPDEP